MATDLAECPGCGAPGRQLGPYRQRKGARIYPYYTVRHNGAPSCWVKAGPPEDAYVDVVHVEADLPQDLVEEIAEAYTYADTFNMGRQRIVGPLGRLIKALGLRYHTDEEVP